MVLTAPAARIRWGHHTFRLLKRHPSTDSTKGKREIAGWNNDFLMQVLVTQRT